MNPRPINEALIVYVILKTKWWIAKKIAVIAPSSRPTQLAQKVLPLMVIS